MKPAVENAELVAYCGLYCGACRKYMSDKCPGCRENSKATWCKIRPCCVDRDIASCADCTEFDRASDCKKFNNLIARLFSLIFRSNRPACIQQIKELGIQGHADNMTETKRQSIKK